MCDFGRRARIRSGIGQRWPTGRPKDRGLAVERTAAECRPTNRLSRCNFEAALFEYFVHLKCKRPRLVAGDYFTNHDGPVGVGQPLPG